MDRRDFLAATALTAGPMLLAHAACSPTSPATTHALSPHPPTPASRRRRRSPTSSPPTPAPPSRSRTTSRPIDVDPKSKTYGQVIHRLQDAQRRRRAASLRLERLRQLSRQVPAALPHHSRLRFQPHPHRRYGRPAQPEDAQGDRAEGGDRQDEADGAAHRPLSRRRPDHDLDARQRQAATDRAASCCWTTNSRSPARGRRATRG